MSSWVAIALSVGPADLVVTAQRLGTRTPVVDSVFGEAAGKGVDVLTLPRTAVDIEPAIELLQRRGFDGGQRRGERHGRHPLVLRMHIEPIGCSGRRQTVLSLTWTRVAVVVSERYMLAAKQRFMVQGLRPTRAAPAPWQQAVRDRLAYRFERIRPNDATALAEAGLRYPRSAYWYLHRSDPAFGRVATLWTLVGSLRVRKSEGTGTPFDTGGVWNDHVIAKPPFSDGADKATFVREHEEGVQDLLTAFELWLIAGHGSAPANYLNGVAPTSHVPRIVLDAGLNDPRAWTWELRLAAATASPESIVPTAIVWPESEYDAFEVWLVNNDTTLSALERSRLLADVRAMSIFTRDPTTAIFQILHDSL